MSLMFITDQSSEKYSVLCKQLSDDFYNNNQDVQHKVHSVSQISIRRFFFSAHPPFSQTCRMCPENVITICCFSARRWINLSKDKTSLSEAIVQLSWGIRANIDASAFSWSVNTKYWTHFESVLWESFFVNNEPSANVDLNYCVMPHSSVLPSQTTTEWRADDNFLDLVWPKSGTSNQPKDVNNHLEALGVSGFSEGHLLDSISGDKLHFSTSSISSTSPKKRQHAALTAIWVSLPYSFDKVQAFRSRLTVRYWR